MSEQNESVDHSIRLEDDHDDEEENDRPFTNEQISEADKDGNPTKKRIHKKSEISNFIMKTYRILEDKKNNHIIQWTEGGNCFIVKNKQLFQTEILPKYFKHRKFSSFVRQLNMYDFHKIRKQKQIPIFKHKFFRMGCHELLHRIKRKSGEDGKEDEDNRFGKSLVELNNNKSDEQIGIKSHAYLGNSKTSININQELQLLLNQNADLKNNIHEISNEISLLENNKHKKMEKLIKITTALVYFDITNEQISFEEEFTIRDLQNHFINEEEPLSLMDYVKKIGNICKNIKLHLIQ